MGKNKKEKIINVLSSSILTLLMLHIFKMFGFEIFISLAPVMIIFIKYGLVEYLISIGIILIGSIPLYTPTIYIINLSRIVILSFIGGLLFKKNVKLTTLIASLALSYLAYVGIGLLISYYLTGLNPIMELKKQIEIVVGQMSEIIKSEFNGVLGNADINLLVENINKTGKSIVENSPTIVLIVGIALSITNTYITKYILSKTENRNFNNYSFSGYPLGEELKAILGVSLISLVFLYIFNIEHFDLIYSNIVLIIRFLIFVNGLFTFEYIYKNKFKKFTRILIYIVLIVLLRATLVFEVIGIMDVFFNLKRIKIIRIRR